MGRKEVYITDIGDVRMEGECVRAELVSGRKTLVLRGSRETLTLALAMGQLALKQQIDAEVVSLHRHR